MPAATIVEPTDLSSDLIRWSIFKKLSFRFMFCYLALYMCPTPGSVGLFGLVPGSSALSATIARGWMEVAPWVAVHLFRLSGDAVAVYRPSGSGDKALDYVLVLVFLLMAAAASLIWSVADRKRANYLILDAWLRLGVRYFLIYQMLLYGLNKVFPVQFTDASLTDLLTPLGMRSMAGAYWTMMGLSPMYVVAAGLSEIAAAMLLIFNRTRIVGAIVTLGVLSNVVAMNYGYNLGVKLFSSHLLAMAAFLVSPHLGALTDLFVFNRAVRFSDIDLFAGKSRAIRLTALSLKFVLLGALIASTAAFNWASYKRVRARPAETPLFGIYDVDAFFRAGREVPPLATDGSRWKKVIMQTPTGVVVHVMTDGWPWPWYRAKYDPDKKMLSLFDVETRSQRGEFAYSQPDSDHVVLDGTLGHERLVVRLTRVNTASLPLLRDKFSWVHEVPPSNQ